MRGTVESTARKAHLSTTATSGALILRQVVACSSQKEDDRSLVRTRYQVPQIGIILGVVPRLGFSHPIIDQTRLLQHPDHERIYLPIWAWPCSSLTSARGGGAGARTFQRVDSSRVAAMRDQHLGADK